MLLLIFTLLPALLNAQTSRFPKPSDVFANHKVLVDDVYQIHWNYTKKNIIAEIQVKTNGWVGFGLSPNGGMSGSDVIIAWIDQTGKTYFTDRHITNDRQVLIDNEQNWFLLGSYRVNGYLCVKFTREIDTCDSQDMVIPFGAAKIIVAWNDLIPLVNGDISYHGYSNRASRPLLLINSLNQELVITADDMIEKVNFNVNARVPPIETYYHCHMFKIPSSLVNSKRHLIRTITNITSGNEQYVHHWLMYQCDPAFETDYLPKVNNSLPLPGHCFDETFTNSANPPNTWNTVSRYCRQISLLWAIGGELVVDFPNGLGFPIGGVDREFNYFYLEMHYNNPLKTSGIVDASGIQWILTPKLRPTEIGVLTNGAASSWAGILIPPGQEKFEFKYFCNNTCLNKFFKGSPVTIFAVAPHTHLTGIEVYTTLVRNGVEVEYIDKSKYYDFNYQNLNFLQEPIVMKPGDEIQTKCVYRTTNRRTYTLGGIGTPQEMCLEFLFYYPRRPRLGGCLSHASADDWKRLFDQFRRNGAMTFTSNDASNIINDFASLKSDQLTVDMIKYFFETANQTQYCSMDTMEQTTGRRFNPKPIIESDQCNPPILNSTSKNIFNFYKILLSIVILLFIKL